MSTSMELRKRNRPCFSGFTTDEIEKMEKLLEKSREGFLNQMFCRKLAAAFSRSEGRAGKTVVKWAEIHSWFENRLRNCFTKSTSPNISKESPAGVEDLDLLRFKFEAKSSSDGAWHALPDKLSQEGSYINNIMRYDVEKFVAHRFLDSGEAEALVRYTGFGAEEDEWVIVRKAVREQSLPLEHSDCPNVKTGDLVVCLQETKEESKYYDAHVLAIERRLHDIRGCRCIFSIRYDHDGTKERVNLKKLCCRPNMLAHC